MEIENESDIINRILAGDTNLFSRIIDCYGASVFRLIKQIIPSVEDSEEIVQDVFLKIFQKLNSFKGDSRFSTWLYRVAYNTAISATRKKKHEVTFFDDSEIINIPDETVDIFFENNADDALIGKLQQSIDCLDAGEKVLITLYYLEDRPVNEIASIMGISPPNVKIRLFRTRKKLYLQLNEEARGKIQEPR